MQDGERMMAQAARLHLLLTHLASPAIRSRVPVEDLVQETFLRAWATGSLPTEDAELYRYLVSVARHTVIDAVRALRARKRTAREVPLAYADWSQGGVRASQVAGRGPGPATLVERSDEERVVRDAFQSLAPDHRRVLGLRQFEGLSAEAAGRRMGRTAAAIHSLYRRALAAWEAATRGVAGE